jgi:hypothetical protein
VRRNKKIDSSRQGYPRQGLKEVLEGEDHKEPYNRKLVP